MSTNAKDFKNKIGSIYTVSSAKGVFKLKLLEFRYSKHKPSKLSWNLVNSIRKNPFSIIFESNQKILVNGLVDMTDDKNKLISMAIEPISESETGYVYQAIFN